MYAIVDIETTGGHASASGITEVAIILHNGKEAEGRYHTLINPLHRIPRYITALTGITNEMVADAPVFSSIAQHIYRLLQGRIFVAHNVNFDYSFLKHHLSESGYVLDEYKLCTVRLSRKIFPGQPSYSLGNICRNLSITNDQRHRALGDASATATLLEKLIAADDKGWMQKMLKKSSREQYLPMNLSADDINNLPFVPGVYYFHNQKDEVIYVGKAKNLRKRVTSHFSNNSASKRKQELVRNVYKITYQPCGTDFMASVLESIEIKRLWPAYNYSQKKWEFSYGLLVFEDQHGFLRLGIEKKRKNLLPVHSFGLVTEGYNLLWGLVKQFGLCPKLCFLQTDDDTCIGIKEKYCSGACEHKEAVHEYNKKVEQALQHLKEQQPSFILLDNGRNENEKSCVVMKDGRFFGMGYVPGDFSFSHFDQLNGYITAYPENAYLHSMILQYATLHPHKKIEL
ncbi:MAG: exonuclease domain-containing protein [Chitinophagaceae bacterium]|nr:exonuclease domain-containing protein [Chitinophagaceae bacterium]